VARITLIVLAGLAVVIAGVAITRGRGGSTNVVGDAVSGKALFKGYCSSCHTLEAAGSTARLGPNLDILKPSYEQVVYQVTTGGTGGAGLPPTARLTFGPGIHTFTKADIRDIAAFVYLSTR
jgi:mono/diheme cytochrome c family protein